MSSTGRSAVIAVGAGFGFLRGLRVLGNINRNAARLGTIQARIDTIQVAIARLAEQTEQIQVNLNERVTKEDLTATVERAFRQMESGFEIRFDQQNRSAEALRIMVGQTDELLQRVLDRLSVLDFGTAPTEGAVPDSNAGDGNGDFFGLRSPGTPYSAKA